jgi:hypothetical protein
MSSRDQREGHATRQARSVTISFSDTLELPRRKIDWRTNGVSLVTKWPFAVGREIEFAFEHRGARHCCVGVVVSCRPLPRQPGHFSTVLYFIEVPCDELRHAACDCQLAHPRYRPGVNGR